jgi:hypothetical protein
MYFKMGVAAYTYNLSTWEAKAKAGGSQVQSQSGLYTKHCLKNTNNALFSSPM